MITKPKPKRSSPVKSRGKIVKSNEDVGSNSELIALFNGIAERGRNIPPEIQDQISREMRESEFCIGSGPVRKQ